MTQIFTGTMLVHTMKLQFFVQVLLARLKMVLGARAFLRGQARRGLDPSATKPFLVLQLVYTTRGIVN